MVNAVSPSQWMPMPLDRTKFVGVAAVWGLVGVELVTNMCKYAQSNSMQELYKLHKH